MLVTVDIQWHDGVDYDEYAWSAVGLFVDPDNRKDYYVGTDSGCSCNSAFEYRVTKDNYGLVGPLTHAQAVEEFHSLLNVNDEWDD